MAESNLPFIPLAVPNIGDAERANLMTCVDTGWVSTAGPFVDELEKEVAKVSGMPGAVAVGAGTMGLHAALIALGVEPGDLVILPTFTFIASANAIAHAGAMPWLMDIDQASWVLDPVALRGILQRETVRDGKVLRHRRTGRRVAAMMPVYVLGTPADMDAICRISQEFGLPVVADAAAAIGALYRGRPIAEFADLTVYSFNGNKTVTSGGGGAVVGQDMKTLSLIKHLTSTARVGRDYDHDRVGYNYRMTNVEAAIGVAQLARLEEFVALKRSIRRRYDEAFADVRFLAPFPDPDWGRSAYWFSGIVLSQDAPISASTIIEELNKRGIGARPFWKPVHLQAPFRDAPAAEIQVSDDLWQRIVTLPCSTSITEAELSRVIVGVHEVLTAASAKPNTASV